MTDKLRPCACPFCGQADNPAPTVEHDGERIYVVCSECGARGPISGTRDFAAEDWNSRPLALAEPPAVLPVVDPEAAPGHALLDGECYRRALDCAVARQIADWDSWPTQAASVCNVADAIAAERERRGGGNG